MEEKATKEIKHALNLKCTVYHTWIIVFNPFELQILYNVPWKAISLYLAEGLLSWPETLIIATIKPFV